MPIIQRPSSSGASMPDNGVVVDAVTGLLETYIGDPIAEASVTTMADLILLTGATYDGTSILVTNPGNNISNYFPAKAFRMNSRWYLENGDALLYAAAPRTRHTWPSATFNPTTPLVSAAAGAQTTIPGGGAHGLSNTNQVTSLTTYVYISGSTGGGTMDWPIGWMQLTDCSVANDLTVLYPYDANLRTPVITEITAAGSGSMAEVARIAIPPLSATGGYEVMVGIKNFVAANEHRCKVWACATGTTLATLIAQTQPVTGLLNNVNDASATPLGFRCGLQNAGSTNVNVGVGSNASTTGFGLGTGALAYSTPGIQTNVPTELVVTFESGTGLDITMELVTLVVRWRY